MLRRLALVVVIEILLCLLPACGDAPGRALPNVIVISLDTTRADHLGCYGSVKARTPNIDALAGRSLRFKRCFTPVPITLPAHTSLLTGQYPLRHSVRDNGSFKVPGTVPTLAAMLGQRGWLTIGVIGGFPLTRRFGLAEGFEVWDEDLIARQHQLLPLAFDQRPADRVTRAALRHVDEHNERPIFLFVHYFDPHRPWQAPALYAAGHPRDPYLAEIAFTDAWVGRLLEGLKQRGFLDDAVVVLTADHGEGLSDHEEETHSYLLYNETIRVPLLLSAPGLRPGVVDRPVSLVDVVPTILDIVGIAPPEELDGRSLLAEPRGPRLIYSETLAGRLQHGWSDLRAAVIGDHKLILSARPELYDLREDLGERRDLAESQPELASSIGARLRRFIASNQGPIPLSEAISLVDTEVARQLEALGYGTAFAGEQELSELGPITAEGDPRLHIELVEIQSIARSLLNRNEIPLALTLIADGLDKHPEDPDLLRLLAIARVAAGDPAGALAAVERIRNGGLAGPEEDMLCSLAAQLDGKTDAALACAERAAATGDRRAARLYARMLSHAGQHARALEVLDEALTVEPCYTEALRERALIERRIGAPEQAAATYERLLSCSPHDPSPLVNLGNLRVEAGDIVGAQALYQRAVEMDPGYALGHYSLGIALLETGRRDRAVECLRKALSLAPVNAEVGRRAAELLHMHSDGGRDDRPFEM